MGVSTNRLTVLYNDTPWHLWSDISRRFTETNGSWIVDHEMKSHSTQTLIYIALLNCKFMPFITSC